MIAPGITDSRSRLGPVPARNRSGARARISGRLLSEQLIQRLSGSMRLSEEDRDGNELMGADAGWALLMLNVSENCGGNGEMTWKVMC